MTSLPWGHAILYIVPILVYVPLKQALPNSDFNPTRHQFCSGQVTGMLRIFAWFFVVFRIKAMDFSDGTVNKNPPANAGDTGSIPGPG